MDITPAIASDAQVIQSYGPAGFKISHVIYRHPVIVLPEKTIAWSVLSAEALAVEDFVPLLQVDPAVEVVLLGAGARGLLLPSALRMHLKSKSIAIDVMDTGAACRTYNVMLSEERRVAAALFPG